MYTYLVKFANGNQVHVVGFDRENAQDGAIAWAEQLGIVHDAIVSIKVCRD